MPIVVAVIAAIGTVIAALAPSLSGGDDGSAPSSGDTPPTTSAGAVATGLPTPSKPAAPTPIDVIAYDGDDRVSRLDPAVDLDASTDGTGGDNIGDVVHTDVALTAGGSALITLLDRAQIPSFDICRSALEERGVNTIAATQIETGVPLCIKTTAGRIGTLTRTNVGKYGDPPKLSIFLFDYMIWQAGPG